MLKKNNKLNFEDQRKVVEAIEQFAASESTSPFRTWERATEYFSKSLGLYLTVGNIQGATDLAKNTKRNQIVEGAIEKGARRKRREATPALPEPVAASSELDQMVNAIDAKVDDCLEANEHLAQEIAAIKSQIDKLVAAWFEPAPTVARPSGNGRLNSDHFELTRV